MTAPKGTCRSTILTGPRAWSTCGRPAHYRVVAPYSSGRELVCGWHARAWLPAGAGGAVTTPTVAERFWSKVDVTGDCWPWTASVDSCGYGRFGIGSKARKANRVAWELARGPIPPGLGVLHRCDNPRCVRPDHLFLGDQKANGLDMSTKGRAPHAKLSVEQVREVRALVEAGVTHAQAARAYGITRPAVSMLVARRTWPDV